MKRAVTAVAIATALAVTLTACPSQSGMHHQPPPTVIIHKP